ncbi:MAG TPA: hypothetical protein VM265_09505 [Sphingomicrobium sp.]|nr:hypothetical protein [Sphingomicrobium sp.]
MGLRTIILVLFALGATGCGRVAPLQPARGQPLPVKPLLARTTPTAEQLLTPPVYASPERIDELMKRSEPRRSDRFDLPPPDGGSAPVLPQTQDPSSSEKVGPATPDEPQ